MKWSKIDFSWESEAQIGANFEHEFSCQIHKWCFSTTTNDPQHQHHHRLSGWCTLSLHKCTVHKLGLVRIYKTTEIDSLVLQLFQTWYCVTLSHSPTAKYLYLYQTETAWVGINLAKYLRLSEVSIIWAMDLLFGRTVPQCLNRRS